MNNVKFFFRNWKNWCADRAKKFENLTEDFELKINFLRKIRIIKLL